MLPQRLAAAAVGLPLLFLAVWFGDPGFSVLIGLAAAVGCWELLRLVAPSAGTLTTALALTVAMALSLGQHIADLAGPWVILWLLATLFLPLAFAPWRRQDHREIARSRWNAMGAAWCLGVLLSFYLALRLGPNGRAWTLLALGATFANDSGAYFIGRLLGRLRLAPAISPKKTIEGALGGLLAGMLATWALAQLQGLPLHLAGSLLLGLGIALVAQAGDLLESYVKRRAGVKDSSRLIPGHGGILDRLDSLLLVGPLVYLGAWLAGRP